MWFDLHAQPNEPKAASLPAAVQWLHCRSGDSALGNRLGPVGPISCNITGLEHWRFSSRGAAVAAAAAVGGLVFCEKVGHTLLSHRMSFWVQGYLT